MNPTKVDLHICHSSQSKEVPFSELSAPVLPAKTDSYMPVAHDDLVKRIQRRLEQAGLVIVHDAHVLWRGGQRYFGLMQVNHPDLCDPDSAMIVGVRNSYDKSLPATIGSGNQVFVCDNLVFNGEVVLGRKHTKNIFEDLEGLIEKAMDVLFLRWRQHRARVAFYKEHEVANVEAHDLIAKSFLSGIISKVQIADAISQWNNPNHPEFKDRNLWNLHNTFTEVMKGRLDTLPRNSRLLHNLLDGVSGFVPPTDSE